MLTLTVDVRRLPALRPHAVVGEPRASPESTAIDLEGLLAAWVRFQSPARTRGVWLAHRWWPDGLRSPPHSHLSLTTEPGQNEGRSPGRATGASSPGPAKGTMALSLPTVTCLPAASSFCKAALCSGPLAGGRARRCGQVQAPGKGPSLPRTERRGQRSRGQDAGGQDRLSSQWPLPDLPRGLPALERCEHLAFPFLGPARSGRLTNFMRSPSPIHSAMAPDETVRPWVSLSQASTVPRLSPGFRSAANRPHENPATTPAPFLLGKPRPRPMRDLLRNVKEQVPSTAVLGPPR